MSIEGIHPNKLKPKKNNFINPVEHSEFNKLIEGYNVRQRLQRRSSILKEDPIEVKGASDLHRNLMMVGTIIGTVAVAILALSLYIHRMRH
jgi:hypothetical protein